MRVNDIFTEDKRADIQRLQRDLNRRGATIQVDGIMGPETLLAIFKFVPEALPPDIKDKLGKIANKSNVGEPEIGRRRPRPSGGKISSTSGFKDPEFNKKLEAVAKRLGIAPEVLRAVIYAESKGVPTAKDPYGVSAGLIGFTRDTARRLGTTRDEILQMTALDQLDLVYDYFRKAGVKPGMTRGDVYMLTFMPVFLNASDDTILGKEGGGELVTPGGKSTGLSMHKVWYQNPVFGRSKGRSYFTVGDVKRHVNSLPAPDIDESINEADINPVDTIELDVPLLLRMMEYAREDAKTDMDLHDVTEKMISLSKTGEGLSMKDYESIVGGEENLAEAGNLNIPAELTVQGMINDPEAGFTPEEKAYMQKVLVANPNGTVNLARTAQNFSGELINLFPQLVDMFKDLQTEITNFIRTIEFSELAPVDQNSIIEVGKILPNTIQQLQSSTMQMAKFHDKTFNNMGAPTRQNGNVQVKEAGVITKQPSTVPDLPVDKLTGMNRLDVAGTSGPSIPPMPNISGLQPGQAKNLGNGERVTLGADGKVYYQGGFGSVVYSPQGKPLSYDTPKFGGAGMKQDLSTGNTTTSYSAGPLSTSQTKNAQGQTISSKGTYNFGHGSVNVDQAYTDGQPTIQTRTGTGSLNRALVKNKDAYNKAIAQQPQQEAIGGNSSEEFLKNVEYKPRHHTKPKRSLMGDPVREGHGRYWCSTDKRWKERQGPKQSRS